MSRDGQRRRVVITGLGLVTPVGIGTEAAWQAVLSGTSGAGEITLLDHTDFPVHFACEVKDFDPKNWIEPREVKKLDRFAHFAIASAALALEEAGLKDGGRDPERTGVVYGSGIGGVLSMEEQYRRFAEKGARRITPFMIPLLMSNAACGNIAIYYDCQGVNYSPVSACATGAHAIGLGLRHIQWNEADVMLVGGAEAGISILGLGGFANMKALSTRNDEPQAASRPFDQTRDGFVLGEGAGCLVLEELEHARARGATIYAELCGYGFTDDAFHITAPNESGKGARRALQQALADAGVDAGEVDYVNAHGTSTPYNDKTETKAIKAAFGEEAARATAISSTKSCTGHTLGAAGAIETAFAALAVREGRMPPTINLHTPDPECDLDYVPNEAREREIRYALSNSNGFGGHNACICLGRYEE
jgi:3-oxoacyl-[acyl-carrier-protein] synthase II